jgi:hypothetical protein
MIEHADSISLGVKELDKNLNSSLLLDHGQFLYSAQVV